MTLENFIYESVSEILNGGDEEVKKDIEKHKEIYKDDTAICFSLLALGAFLKKDNTSFYQFMNDAAFLVDQSVDSITKIFHEMILGFVNFTEKNTTLYAINYNKARKLSIKSQKTEFFERVNKLLKCPPISHYSNHNQTKDPLIALVNIGQAVAAEKNIDLLIKTIAEETKTALNADRCTIFMYDKENNELYSKVATGLDTKELRIPADKGLAGHVVQTGETINIKDAYNDKRFNPNVDKKTGYRTKTILCMPIKNFNQEIIGVFQVLNKFDEYFTPDDEDLLIAIASSAGISLENAQLFERQRKLLEEQKVVLDSFIETLATSIDARDKITSGHSSRVKMYSSLIAQEFGMEKNDLYILEKAAALHDIGKIGIPESILKKQGRLTEAEYMVMKEHVENAVEMIRYLPDMNYVLPTVVGHHERYDGKGYPAGLAGEAIPLGARCLALADSFDTMTARRPYKEPMQISYAVKELEKGKNTQFDPYLTDVFLRLIEEGEIQVWGRGDD